MYQLSIAGGNEISEVQFATTKSPISYRYPKPLITGSIRGSAGEKKNRQSHVFVARMNQLTNHCHIGCFKNNWKCWRIPRHFTLVGAC